MVKIYTMDNTGGFSQIELNAFNLKAWAALVAFEIPLKRSERDDGQEQDYQYIIERIPHEKEENE